ncbi:MAG: hypothetical protein V4622_09700 [Bacteroidota bacterium]
MKKITLFLLLFVSPFIFSQDDEEEKDEVSNHKTELGLDGFANASSFGGSFGVGAKYGVIKNKNIIFGPSLRLQRSWSNYYGQKYGFTIFGGGAFVHYRLKNSLFVGAELEVLKCPTYYNNVYSIKRWVPTCFVGGGFSHEFVNIGFRLNAGVFYDVISNPSSPFFTSYILKKENGTPVPLIYRIGFFFPLN